MPFGSSSATTTPSCRSLVHIGDSTSAGIKTQLRDNYRIAGFRNIYISAGNGRSLAYSTSPDTMNGVQAIRYYKKKLGSGTCWVIALGTNDAASTSRPDDPARIDSAMKAVDGDPVMWVNVAMNSRSRPNYSAAAAKTWNNLLSRKMSRYENASILDWASWIRANPGWLASDGYHYNSFGSRRRSQVIPAVAGNLFKS